MNQNFKQHFRAVIFILATFSYSLYSTVDQSNFESDKQSEFSIFSESFIRHYEFNPEGRYTHEYHPFILDKTGQSFGQLEQRLRCESFELAGRIVIVGYEENAVPSYYTNYRQSHINDEAMVRNEVGWSLRLHNRFGFMTGFLFKDFNKLAACYFGAKDHVFEHIDAEQIPIFDDRANVFHEHAFGEAYQLVLNAQVAVTKKFKERRFLDIFSDLVKFWQIMYHDALKVGNKQVAGTQDILFSIAYAKHLLSSKLQFFNYFTGPDITYPIEITTKHDKYVSRHAMSFVNRLYEKLIPVENKTTAYIFCSFVDGVGKSTTLGNIKNAMKYGSDVDSFEHVDNSSSQLAEVFECKSNVFIADLPAQMSHFTYKPDGLVYVDARTEFDREEVDRIIDHFFDNKALYEQNYEDLLKEVKRIKNISGFCDPVFYDKSNPELAFAKNILLLKRKLKNWIPFSLDGKHYLIKESHPTELRVLIPLGDVKSEGLKNIESEQMLFFDGIRLPLPYQNFLDDLVNKLKSNDVKKIVFVDFMSMYPRSSRENVRINYLLQQMAHIEDEFDTKYSLYKDFVSCGELLSSLINQKTSKQLQKNFELEILVRYALYKIILERQSGGIDGFSIPNLTSMIKEKASQIYKQYEDALHSYAGQKVILETERMEKIFGMTKDFVNIQNFSFQHAAAFSQQLQEFFTTRIDNEKINILWSDQNQKIKAGNNNLNEGSIDVIMRTLDDARFRIMYKFDSECRSEQLLTQFLRDLRVYWYAAICLLIDAQKNSGKLFKINSFFPVPPVFLKAGTDGNFYLTQRLFDQWAGEMNLLPKIPYDLFNVPLSNRIRFGIFEDCIFRLDWKPESTNRGLFAFACDLSKIKKRGFYTPSMFMIAQRYQNEHGTNVVIPTHTFEKKLNESAYWNSVYRGWQTEADKRGRITENKNNNSKKVSWFENFSKTIPQKSSVSQNRSISWASDDQRSPIKMFVRLLATLEMVVKDPDAHIVVRFGNRKDFKAALELYEKVTLPYFFGILFKDPLFKDYDKVEPYPSWDFWDCISKE